MLGLKLIHVSKIGHRLGVKKTVMKDKSKTEQSRMCITLGMYCNVILYTFNLN